MKKTLTQMLKNFSRWLVATRLEGWDNVDLDREFNSTQRTAKIRSWEHRYDRI